MAYIKYNSWDISSLKFLYTLGHLQQKLSDPKTKKPYFLKVSSTGYYLLSSISFFLAYT